MRNLTTRVVAAVVRSVLNNHIGDAFFSNYRLYRSIAGGHWEQWYVEAPVHSVIWFRIKECTCGDRGKIHANVRCNPVCEVFLNGINPKTGLHDYLHSKSWWSTHDGGLTSTEFRGN